MKFKDLREFILFLEEKGELRRVTAPVSWDLEISEIADRMVKSGGPALLFENVTGYDVPLVINLFASTKRMAMALGVEDLDELAERVQGLLNMMQGPPEGLINRLRTLGQLVHLGRHFKVFAHPFADVQPEYLVELQQQPEPLLA